MSFGLCFFFYFMLLKLSGQKPDPAEVVARLLMDLRIILHLYGLVQVQLPTSYNGHGTVKKE